MSDEPRHFSASLAELRDRLGREPTNEESYVARIGGADGVDDAVRLSSLRDDRRTDQWARTIPSRFRWAALDKLDADVASNLAAWVDAQASDNLLITGSTGPGKSFAAVAACRACFDRGADVVYAPTTTLLATLRPGGMAGVAPMAMEDYLLVDRLIIDDLGSENLTEWGSEQLYLIVDQRWLEERPTVTTTNLSTEELEARYGSRLISRLADGLSLSMTGTDRRRA